MKNSNLNKTFFVILALAIIASIITGCSENPMGTSNDINVSSKDNPLDTGVTVQLGRQVNTNFYLITVVNNTNDTINDFHIQWADSTVRSMYPNTMNSGWTKTYGGNNHTDSSKVDLKTTRGLAYNPIKPGHALQLLGFYIGWGKSPSKKIKFNTHWPSCNMVPGPQV